MVCNLPLKRIEAPKLPEPPLQGVGDWLQVRVSILTCGFVFSVSKLKKFEVSKPG